ncbi:MAG: FtsQ-type POTRA domain-containing protein [Selenomonadaceae bacterium]|nr:FtsQ-type POTRA domain-containing protein [Selenomonadaceae bacterium]
MAKAKKKGSEKKLKQNGKRRSPHRLLKGLLFLVIGTALVGVLVYSPLFTLQGLKVTGQTYLTERELMEIAGVSKGEPLFQLDTIEVTRRLLRDLRIESATVHRVLPDALEFNIKERTPVATVACDYGYLDLDRQGKIIDGYKTLKNMPIPMITGITLHDVYIGDDNTDPTVKGIIYFLEQLDEVSLNQISEVAIIRADYIVAYTTTAVQIRLGALERLEDKAKLTQEFLGNLARDPRPVEFVDFSYTAPFIKFAR